MHRQIYKYEIRIKAAQPQKEPVFVTLESSHAESTSSCKITKVKQWLSCAIGRWVTI